MLWEFEKMGHDTKIYVSGTTTYVHSSIFVSDNI